jgi:WD40 repeat protein
VSGPSKRHAEGILAVVFTPSSAWHCVVSPDGKWIATRKKVGKQWKAVEVWDSKAGKVAGTFSEHTDGVFSISFSPDSKRILTTSVDKTIRVRNINF